MAQLDTKGNGMSFKDKAVSTLQSRQGLKKFSEWDGDWDSYLDYLNQHSAVSENIERRPDGWKLRDGYHPPWTEKDFK